jgi:hypothetical protein
MSTEEEQDEMVFSSVLLEQKEKVEQECAKLQTLINIEASETSFIWLPDSGYVNIIDNIFHKAKRIREDDDDDDDDDDDNHDDDDDDDDVLKNSVVTGNTGVPQIFMKKIGRKRTITPEIVVPENGVVLEVEGNQSPPSFVPYSMINSGKHNTQKDIEGSQTPEHVSWDSESPKTPWSQQREHHLLVPLNSDPVDIPNTYYYPTGKGLFFLFIILYIFIF